MQGCTGVIAVTRAWLLVAFTLAATVAGQVVLKLALQRQGSAPGDSGSGLVYVRRALLDPWVLLSLGLAILAALSWIAALGRLSLGAAYPFMSLSFVLVAFLSALLLGEPISATRWAGIAVVVAGLVLVARG